MRAKLISLAIIMILSGCTTMVVEPSYVEQQKSVKLRVYKSTPIYEESHIRVPHTEYVRKRSECPADDTNSIGLDTIIGSIIGIVIGHQVVHKNPVGKIAGGAAGAVIANKSRRKPCYKQVAITTYHYENKKVLVGYENCARFNGRDLCTRDTNKKSYIYLNY